MDNDYLQDRLRESGARWLRIFWCDYTSTIRCRLIPMAVVREKLARNEPVTLTITQACLGLLPNDHMIPGMAGVGGYTLVPDWTSLRSGPTAGQVSCVGEFKDKDDSSEAPLCPRTVLRRVLDEAKRQGLEFILGFEIEFIAMERNPDMNSPEQYLTLSNDGHAWSTARSLSDWGREGSFNSILDELTDNLEDAKIPIEQLHIESAPGQYEVVLRAVPAMEACDNYLYARQIIESTAARHGFRVSMHPKPFLDAPGNAAHVHMSISSAAGDDTSVYESFYAGILSHIRAVTAFTYANPVSYERVADSSWAGGRWISWGSENRETPLRKCDGGHWEFRLLDGLANPYLALAAILGAGTAGVSKRVTLSTWKDCQDDPACLSPIQREELGITERLPLSLKESLAALEDDQSLKEILHQSVIQRHVEVKEAEIALLEGMGDEERRQWILARF